MSLIVGRIDYLNCAPFFHHLSETGFEGQIVSGVPSELNRLLATGEIDVCPSSSIEYALHSDDYLLLPGHSISSVGPVHSVLLFTNLPMGMLNGARVALTGESATSVNLLHVMLKEFCGVSEIDLYVPDEPIEEVLAQGGNALLIGDRALWGAQNAPADLQVIDLGALWYHFTGLPFVFALWIARKTSVAQKKMELSAFARQLAQSRQQAFADLPSLATELEAGSALKQDELVGYWQSMSYELTEGHLEGLKLFFSLCKKHGLLDEVPTFDFWSVDD